MRWTNVRPISAEREAEVFRVFNAIQSCFEAPAWAAFDGEPDEREAITICCKRCGIAHTYRAYLTSARRRFCDACVRTSPTPTKRTFNVIRHLENDQSR